MTTITKELERLLYGPTPLGGRVRSNYNPKVEQMPVPGDIVRLESKNDKAYALVYKTVHGGERDSSIECYMLKSSSALPQRRSELLLITPLRPLDLLVVEFAVTLTIVRLMSDEETLLSKAEAGYIRPPHETLWPEPGKGIRCGTCIYYRNGLCGVVEGSVHDQGCCNLWSADQRPDVSGFLDGKTIAETLDGNLEW